MKYLPRIILAILLLSGGCTTMYAQDQYGHTLGSEADAYRSLNPGGDLRNFSNVGRNDRRNNDKDRDALKPHWAIFDFSDTLTFLIRDECPEYYLGAVSKVDKKKGLCLRHGKGIFRTIEDDGGSTYYVGPWKRDMMHGLVIYRENGCAGTMTAEFWYDVIKKKTIRPATPEEAAALDEAIRKIDTMQSALDN